MVATRRAVLCVDLRKLPCIRHVVMQNMDMGRLKISMNAPMILEPKMKTTKMKMNQLKNPNLLEMYMPFLQTQLLATQFKHHGLR